MIGVATLNSLDRSQPAAAPAAAVPVAAAADILPPLYFSATQIAVGGGRKQNGGQISGLNYVFTLEDLDKLQVSTTAEGHEHHYRIGFPSYATSDLPLFSVILVHPIFKVF